jgi:hypothetical protein
MSVEPNIEARKDRRPRLLYICDWLPPDFGDVGQYGALFARQLAQSGMDVVLCGLSLHRIRRHRLAKDNFTTVVVR